MARRKSSKCPEPINTMLDIAGAVTLGLYAKHKIKKDFEKGEGEASAKAGSMVFGYGAMRGGSRGIMSLGGLIGLNSGLKDIERQQQQSEIYEPPFIDEISDTVKKTPKKVRSNMWREQCEDGSAYGLNPHNFSSADDYADALKAAKKASITDNVEDNTQSSENVANLKQDEKRHIWRKFCEDGSKYGINPEDFNNADDYEEALNKAKENNYEET